MTNWQSFYMNDKMKSQCQQYYHHQLVQSCSFYTVSHKKMPFYFWSITVAFLDRFIKFLYCWKGINMLQLSIIFLLNGLLTSYL